MQQGYADLAASPAYLGWTVAWDTSPWAHAPFAAEARGRLVQLIAEVANSA